MNETKSTVRLNQSTVFEKEVFDLLSINSDLFELSASQYNGYALLLRKWIKESFNNGDTPQDVATLFKDSAGFINLIQFIKPPKSA